MLRNPMHEARQALAVHPRCGAHSRRTGNPCKNPSMPNGRCRMHGGKSTGRPITTGEHTKCAKADRRRLSRLIKTTGKLINTLMLQDADPDEVLERMRTYEAL